MKNKYIELNHRHNPSSIDVTGTPSAQVYTGSSDRTISEIAMDLYNTTGKSVPFIVHSGGAPSSQECVAYIVDPADGKQFKTPWNSVLVPGGCLLIPPAQEWCKITSPEIVLEHGTVTLKQADGDVATESMNLQCTVPASVTFNLISQDKYVYLDEGKSEITVDGKPLNSKVDLPQGDSQMPVKDLLTGVTKEGFHTGSSVLVMMPY
ncbi:PapG chaperone-binding domain-containing protein [Enterobacter asburiae]